VQSPVLTTADDVALDVRLESFIQGQYSNSQQIIYTRSLNVSSVSRSILFRDTGVQLIDLIGSQFRRVLNYTCHVFTLESDTTPLVSTRALYNISEVISCPLDTRLLTVESNDYYKLKLSLNTQVKYELTLLTVLSRPQLQGFYPHTLYNDGNHYSL